MRRSILTAAACAACVVIGRLTAPVPAAADTPVGNGDVNGDGAIDISDGVYILNWLFTGGPAPVAIESPACDSCCPPVCPPERLPATGQAECYGSVEGSWQAVPCEGAEVSGQDGAYQAGCPMAGRFVDHGDGTVTDTCTGLMWQQDTADISGNGSIGEWPEDAVVWQDALNYCEAMSFAGHDDWRLPNVRELASIVDYGRLDLVPTIDPVFGAQWREYWSSSTIAHFPGNAWGVDFRDGSVSDVDDDSGRTFVRAVRNAQ